MRVYLLTWWVACLLSFVWADEPILGGLLGGSNSSHQPSPSSLSPPLSASALSSSLPAGTSSSAGSTSGSGQANHTTSQSTNDQPIKPPDVVVTSYVADQATSTPSSPSGSSIAAPDSDDNGSQHLITGVIVVCCVVAATTVAIFIFRRIKLKPSHSFKQKLSSRPPSFVSPPQHNDAVFLRELQQV